MGQGGTVTVPIHLRSGLLRSHRADPSSPAVRRSAVPIRSREPVSLSVRELQSKVPAAMEAARFGRSQFSALRLSSATSSTLDFLPNHHIYRTNLKFKFSSSASVRPSAASNSVTLLDYGAGNIRSVRNAIRVLGFDIIDVQTPEDILNANCLIFPGVGAFAAAMDVLNQKGMAEALCTCINNDRPFLGIGVGQQILFESSEENGPVQGLGLIPGVVGRFDSSNGLIVPHMDWKALQVIKDSEILDDMGNHRVYFAHSYRAMPSNYNKEWITSICNYGGDNFIASVGRGNVHAVQFQPEKSGEAGLSVLRRFLSKSLT